MGKIFNGLRVETVNTTGLRNLKHRICHTEAVVVMCQETKVPLESVPEARAALRRLGWRAAFSPAMRGPAGGLSGGVCICARAWLDFWPHEVESLVQGRLVQAWLNSRKFGRVALYSTYLVSGQGTNEPNEEIVAVLLDAAAAHGLPFLAGGDWQSCPSGLADLISANPKVDVWAPEEHTFKCSTGESTLDYFLADARLAPALSGLEVIHSALVPQHRPVHMIISTGVGSTLVKVAARQPKLPADRQQGPQQQPPEAWGDVRAAVAAARGPQLCTDEGRKALVGKHGLRDNVHWTLRGRLRGKLFESNWAACAQSPSRTWSSWGTPRARCWSRSARRSTPKPRPSRGQARKPGGPMTGCATSPGRYVRAQKGG